MNRRSTGVILILAVFLMIPFQSQAATPKETMLKKGRVEVQSYLQTSDGKKIPLFYRLTDKSGSWKVYDVIIEGVSMVKNYRTQFKQNLAKDSPDKLIEILREKVKKG